MRRLWQGVWLVTVALAAQASCGGESETNPSTGGAGTGGGGTGGTADAGVDASTCPTGQVPTIEGCLGCTDAFQHLYDEIEKARMDNAACNTVADCVMTDDSTACSGSCGVAVSKSGEAAFKSALGYWDGAYCSSFVAECGYSTPKCALPTLVCDAGICGATY